MSQASFLIGVEGNHDQAFIERILHKSLKLQKFKGTKEDLEELDVNKIWRKFIPKYPTQKGRLYERLDMPSLLRSEDSNLLVGIYAGGGSKLVGNLKDKLSNISSYLDFLDGFAIIADSDKKMVTQVAENYAKELEDCFPGFISTQDCLGQVVHNSLRLGLYILPNNKDQGVLETLLCQCGDFIYKDYMERAEDYLVKFSQRETSHWSNFDREKAKIAAIASILKPGKTNTTTITDNQWVSKETLEQLPDMVQLVRFLKELLGIED